MLNEKDLRSWINSPETQLILTEIQKELDRIKQEINLGQLLQSEYLEREYCVSVGQVLGLNYIFKLIDSITKEEDVDENIIT